MFCPRCGKEEIIQKSSVFCEIFYEKGEYDNGAYEEEGYLDEYYCENCGNNFFVR